jgi:hypothetical protein
MDTKERIIGIGQDGRLVVWVPPAGMDPAVPYESLLVGAAVYALSGDDFKAETAALEHYYGGF